jgi:hypothetical protein
VPRSLVATNYYESSQDAFEFDGKLSSPRGSLKLDDIEYDVVQTLENMVTGLTTGSEGQKLCVLAEVQRLNFHCKEHDMLSSLIPIMCERVISWNIRLQLSVAEALAGVVGDNLPADLADTIVATAFHVIRDQVDPEIFRCWGQLLVGQLPFVRCTPKAIKTIVEELDRPDDPDKYRRELSQNLLARIIGPLSVSSNPELVLNFLLVRALALLNDENVDVRCNVIESIGVIGSVVDSDTLEKSVWPGLNPLVSCNNPKLRAAVLRTISRIAAAHRKVNPDAYFFTVLLPPVFLEQCTYSRRMASMDQRLLDADLCCLVEVQAEVFGEFLFSCRLSFGDDTAFRQAFKTFQAFSICNGTTVRRNCAYNVPGVGLCMKKRYGVEMAVLVETLSRDSDMETRRILAAGMHETAKQICDADSAHNIVKTVYSLLHDDSPAVRMSVLRSLDSTLATLATRNLADMVEMVEGLLQNLQLLLQGTWRTRELLAKQLRLVAPYLPPQCIRQNILPILYKLMAESSFTVRKSSALAIAICFRQIPSVKERKAAVRIFCLEWAYSDLCWKRLCFLYCAEAALQTYSCVLFRDLFTDHLVPLAHDPTSNIRLRLAASIPRFAPACHQTDCFRDLLAAIREDSDVDVKAIATGIGGRIQKEVNASMSRPEQDISREVEEREIQEKHVEAGPEVSKKKISTIIRTGLMGLSKSQSGSPGATTNYSLLSPGPNSSRSLRFLKEPSNLTNDFKPGGETKALGRWEDKDPSLPSVSFVDSQLEPKGDTTSINRHDPTLFNVSKELSRGSIAICIPAVDETTASTRKHNTNIPTRLSLGLVSQSGEEALFSPAFVDSDEAWGQATSTGQVKYPGRGRISGLVAATGQMLSPRKTGMDSTMRRGAQSTEPIKGSEACVMSPPSYRERRIPRAASWASAIRKSVDIQSMPGQAKALLPKNPGTSPTREGSHGDLSLKRSITDAKSSRASQNLVEESSNNEGIADILIVDDDDAGIGVSQETGEGMKTDPPLRNCSATCGKGNPIKLRHGTTYQKSSSRKAALNYPVSECSFADVQRVNTGETNVALKSPIEDTAQNNIGSSIPIHGSPLYMPTWQRPDVTDICIEDAAAISISSAAGAAASDKEYHVSKDAGWSTRIPRGATWSGTSGIARDVSVPGEIDHTKPKGPSDIALQPRHFDKVLPNREVQLGDCILNENDEAKPTGNLAKEKDQLDDGVESWSDTQSFGTDLKKRTGANIVDGVVDDKFSSPANSYRVEGKRKPMQGLRSMIKLVSNKLSPSSSTGRR